MLTVYYSFFEWNLLKPGSFKFAWLENYAALITNSSIRVAIWNTVLLTLCVIGISVVLGLAVAMLLNSDVFGKGFMRTLMIAPFLIMPTAGALVWKDTLLNPLFGLLPYLLTPFGLSRVDWVNQFPMVTVVAVEVWRWTPFMMLIILAGLQSQNPEVLEAARVDGASAFQAFRRITLPLARPFIELGALLGSLFVVQTYDSIFMLTYGGPGEDTTNIPFLLYKVAFQGYSIGQASAIGVVAVIFTIIIVIQFVVITKGATRIAEVAARFTLDAMPGKQMAIDADLNAGLINEREARERRRASMGRTPCRRSVASRCPWSGRSSSLAPCSDRCSSSRPTTRSTC